MAFTVERKGETEYYVDLGEPERTWLSILSGKMVANCAVVLVMAISQGLMGLLKDFGRPESKNPEGG